MKVIKTMNLNKNKNKINNLNIILFSETKQLYEIYFQKYYMDSIEVLSSQSIHVRVCSDSVKDFQIFIHR